MNVLLIMPSFEEVYGSYRHLYKKGFVNPPLGLCYLAAALEEAGHKVRIIDAEAQRLTLDRVVEAAVGDKPGLIGLTATSIDFHKARQLAQALKAALPGTPVILGGTHVNIFGAAVLEENPCFDLACVGDGEDLIRELADALDAGGGRSLDHIAGLVFRRDGEVVRNPDRPIEMDIARYPFPARRLLDNSLYRRDVPFRGTRPAAAFMSSRGCPFSCVYCAVKNIHGGVKVRLRPADDVLEELAAIVAEFGPRHINFNDDCLTLNRDRTQAICEGIRRRGLDITWEGLSRADLLDPELLRAMKAAGLVRLSIGIESGNPDILKKIKKGETLEQIEAAINMVHDAGIVTRGSVIVGNPYEDSGTVRDTMRFINRVRGLDQVVINILQPYPGTKVRDMVLSGEGGARFVGADVGNDKLQRFGTANVCVNDLTPERLVALQKYGFLRFYLRPAKLINNFRMTGARTFFSDGFAFLRSVLGA